MRKLIATTALALIIGGPALAQQQAQPDAQPIQQQQQVTQDQPAIQDPQQVTQDQQMFAQEGFYQPQPQDLFITALMNAQVYAPAQRDAAGPGAQQQDQQVAQQQMQQPGDQQQQVTQLQTRSQQLEQDIQQLQQAQVDQQQVQQLQQQVEQLRQQVEQLQSQPDQQQLQQVEQQFQQVEQQLQQLQQQAGIQPGQQPAGQQAAQPIDPQPAQQPAEQQAQVQPGEQPMQQLTQQQQLTPDQLAQMENIGQVTDIIIDEQGEIRAVVVEVGGFLGIGTREVALDMNQIDFGRDPQAPDQLYVVTHIGANELEQAPEFDRAQLQEEQRQQWAATQPAQPMQPGQQQVEQQQVEIQPVQPDQQQAEQQQVEVQPVQPGQQQVEQQQVEVQPVQPDQQQAVATPQDQAMPGAMRQDWRGERQTLVAPQIQREGFQAAEIGEISADNLLGANVYDVNDDNIGSINDVVLDTQGQVQYAVIDIGGFLGLGAHTVALGFDEIQVLHDPGWADVRVYVDATREQLEALPEYDAAAVQ